LEIFGLTYLQLVRFLDYLLLLHHQLHQQQLHLLHLLHKAMLQNNLSLQDFQPNKYLHLNRLFLL
jgi:hypothetical protein